MNDLTLHTSKKNDVHECLTKAGFDPKNDFEFREQTLRPIINMGPGGLVKPAGEVSVLVCKQNERFWFLFDTRGADPGEFVASLSPSGNTQQTSIDKLTWPLMVKLVAGWARLLRIELDQPDLWEEFTQQTALFDAAVTGDDDEPFGPDEKKDVLKAVERLEVHLLDAFEGSQEKQLYIEKEIRLLRLEADSQSRAAWRRTLYGVLWSIVWGLALAPDQMKNLFQIASDALSGFVGIPKLP